MADGGPRQVYYHDYLQLDRLLDCQDLESEKAGATAHDEMLFIIVHQAYELWFKQILWELEAAADRLSGETIDEKDVGRAVRHLERVVEIQRVTVQQIDILETMTPLDFLDFRDFLIPASGFQSVQFRLIENRLGMRPEDRLNFGRTKYSARLREDHRHEVEAVEKSVTLFDLVERWLARTPFLRFGGFDFWSAYREAVTEMLEHDAQTIRSNSTLSGEQIQKQLEGLRATREQFEAITRADDYNKLVDQGAFRMTHDAFTAALLINLYRDEPILHLPYRLLKVLVDIDENFSTWRYRHALMVLRMIGAKIGTGGSAGHDYLTRVAHQNKVFKDLFRVSTFLIPRSAVPELPADVRSTMGFRFK